MTTVLTRAELSKEIARFIRGEIRGSTLAAWAFDQIYAEEAGEVEFEPGYAAVIDDVLDELLFGDDPPFLVDAEHAQRLIRRLETATMTEASADE